MVEKLGSVPNFFYDFIVFVTPTIGIAIGISIGLSGNILVLEQYITKAGPLGTITIFLLLIFASYEYGRLAETFSDIFVGGVIELLRKIGLFSSSDYRRNLTKQVSILPIDIEKLDGRSSSKWTIYFFALYVNPQLGSDLLKRYAWEKLARSSGFTVGVLFIVSTVVHIIEKICKFEWNQSIFQFGGYAFSLITLTIYIVLLIDYYKRNCWNNDLLITTVPVLVENHMALQKHSVTEVSANVELKRKTDNKNNHLSSD